MKKIIGILVAIIVFAGCSRKEDIPSINQKYIGLWTYEDAESEYTLNIKEDATAEYKEVFIGGYKTVTGYIYFDGNDFKIGTKRINKKFKTQQTPKKIITSTTPYKYYYTATFNGIVYTKD
jgi:hypothetical protein